MNLGSNCNISVVNFLITNLVSEILKNNIAIRHLEYSMYIHDVTSRGIFFLLIAISKYV